MFEKTQIFSLLRLMKSGHFLALMSHAEMVSPSYRGCLAGVLIDDTITRVILPHAYAGKRSDRRSQSRAQLFFLGEDPIWRQWQFSALT